MLEFITRLYSFGLTESNHPNDKSLVGGGGHDKIHALLALRITIDELFSMAACHHRDAARSSSSTRGSSHCHVSDKLTDAFARFLSHRLRDQIWLRM